LLVEFHENATGLYVVDWIARHPNAFFVFVYDVCTAPPKPPTTVVIGGTVAWIGTYVVVTLWSTELVPIGVPCGVPYRRHRITGVSAVPGHRQSVLANLITDGERRVFSRVPQTRSTLDLLTDRRKLIKNSNSNLCKTYSYSYTVVQF